MKTTFPEYYQPGAAKKKKMIQGAILVLDANVLLGLYRYTKETRNDWLEFLKKRKAPIWISHQFALEFQRNRLKVIDAQESAFEEILNEYNAMQNKLITELGAKFKRHPCIDLGKIVPPHFEAMKKELDDCKKDLPAWSKKDDIHSSLSKVLKGKIGSSEKENRTEEVKKRYENKIPPGYLDMKKEDPYGDGIGWLQILDKAKTAKEDMVLVTDDKKADWWLSIRGKIRCPHYHLIKEFKMAAGDKKDLLIYTVDEFVKYSGMSEKTRKEVAEIAKEKTEDLKVTSSIEEPQVGLQAPAGSTDISSSQLI